jgi:poly-beta-hydroxybutyrate-responsive repressor
LLLLLQQPGHGYELLERLANQPDMPQADPGLLYRTLRQMERQGLLSSAWDTSGEGPARRQYRVTDEGIEFLHAWAVEIDQMRRHMERFLKVYGGLFESRKEY